ncbi:S-adenosyl-L-methionine-dependent methyltransferase [Vigna unguiculata]|uniref:Methyltransferase n=1 Tax=Vigna unguiculata TaxID=3917 RepID=A0A4D6L2A2_VIGUN|nr:S-adenosyl-L-methionine-dependent methyltransferase [Vigna unguiculata]
MRSSWLKKQSFIIGHKPPLSWLILCLISILALIAVLSSSSSSNTDGSASRTAESLIYTNYRRIKEQAAVDYLELRSVSSGGARQKEVVLCGKERENFVPCHNVSANLISGFKDGEEFDRHCEVYKVSERCLVRPPKEYKTPLRWPSGRDVIWSANVKITKDQFLSSGSMTKRLMLLEENQIAFHSQDGFIFNSVKDYARQLAEMIGLGSDIELPQAGIRNILDINCGFGSFGAHLLSLKIMVVCIAAYEATGSQVQLSLERGLPAMIGNFISRQLPYPSLSYDMVHCAQCGIMWDEKDGLFLIEVDRVLKPGGYFVLTSPTRRPQGSSKEKKRIMSNAVEGFTQQLCWTLVAQQDETFVWQKTPDVECYASRKQSTIQLCEGEDTQSYYRHLVPCISGTSSKRWIAIQNRSSESGLSSAELKIHGKCEGVQPEEFYEDLQHWRTAVNNYWSLLTPLIFSDHPKRLGDEDPFPPYNMVRNVMDMSANFGGLNAALLEEKKSVWVMNVVSSTASNALLPLILDRGFAGVMHDWCEPFPTYPRTYDLLHADGLLSHLSSERCSTIDLFLEMDRILRPEGWVILSDTMGAIEMARMVATQVRWEARVIDLQNGSDQRLLICQKPFVKK